MPNRSNHELFGEEKDYGWQNIEFLNYFVKFAEVFSGLSFFGLESFRNVQKKHELRFTSGCS